MALLQLDINGSPYVGVFARASDEHLLLPNVVPEDLREKAADALGVTATVVSVGGSNILGSIVAMNSRGAMVADFAEDAEVRRLQEMGLSIGRVAGKFNAAGNNILCNDKGALINPDLSQKAEQLIAETLGVDVRRGTLAGIKTVGSAACATNKGVLCHPKTRDDELDALEELLGVEADIGTVNHGAPYLGAGIVANTNGALVGTLTTGPERNRIENALDLI